MLRGVVGQLSWLAGISRPDISFDSCQASTRIKNATVADVLVVNKIVQKIKNVLLPCLDLSIVIIKLMLVSITYPLEEVKEELLPSCVIHLIIAAHFPTVQRRQIAW